MQGIIVFIFTITTGYLAFKLDDLSDRILLITVTIAGIMTVWVRLYEGAIFTKQIKGTSKNIKTYLLNQPYFIKMFAGWKQSIKRAVKQHLKKT